MTVSVLRNQVQYTGNNSTTAFTVSFPYTEKSQVKVYLDGSLQTITTHYTLTDPDSTGTVTFGTAPGTGVIVSLIRETDFLQTVDYANNDILDAETLEAAFDKLTMMCQQVKNLADKSVGFDETVNESETTSLKLAAGTGDLAGKLLAFDDSGNFVTTQEIGTFRGSDSTTTTASYVVRDLIRDSSNDNVYFTKVDAPSGTLLTNTTYFELLVDVETVRGLKVDAETARTGAETAETNAEAALASFQGQYKSSATDPYGGSADAGDLWYDETNSILKYYTGSAFEPVTTSLATVTGNYLTISNQVITAGVVPVTLGGTGSTTASGARTALGVSIGSDVQAWDQQLDDISALAVTDGNIIVGNGTNWVAESGAVVRASLGLGTVATTDSDAYATAAQGELADSAVQPSDLATTLNTSSTNVLLGRSTAGAGSVEEISLTSAGRALLDDADSAAQRTTLGLGFFATRSIILGFTSLGGFPPTAEFISYVTYNDDQVLFNKIDLNDQYNFENSLAVSLGGTGGTTASAARTNLGLGTLATQDSITESQISDLQAYLTASSTATLTNKSGNISQWTNDSGYLTAETNNLSTVSGTLGTANGGTGVTSLASLNAADLGSNNGVTDATDGYVLTADGTGGVAWEAATGGSGINNVVDDLSPQLGGNLDVNGNSIVSVSAGNISITPDTTGKIILDGLSWPTSDGSADQVLKTDGAGNLSFVNQSGGGGSGTSYIEHSSTVSDSLAISTGTNRMYVGRTDFSSGGVTMAGTLIVAGGYANFTSASALNITGTLNVI
jgi:hypothetical protein